MNCGYCQAALPVNDASAVLHHMIIIHERKLPLGIYVDDGIATARDLDEMPGLTVQAGLASASAKVKDEG